jgi:hypothetical protein
MILRFTLLFYAMISCAGFVDFSFTRNFFAGKYSSDADSIGIPIIFYQIFFLSSFIMSSPIVLLGNKKFRNWLSSLRKLYSVPLVVVFSFLYLVLFWAGMVGLAHITSDDWGYQLFDATALFGSVLFFFLIDMIRLYVFLRGIHATDKFSWFFQPKINF